MKTVDCFFYVGWTGAAIVGAYNAYIGYQDYQVQEQVNNLGTMLCGIGMSVFSGIAMLDRRQKNKEDLRRGYLLEEGGELETAIRKSCEERKKQNERKKLEGKFKK